MKKLLFSFAAPYIIFLFACSDPHARDSRIVQEVVAAGAGDPSHFTDPGLDQWFSAHLAVARKIAAECIPLGQNQPATWIFTAEGTACHAAGLVVARTPKEYGADTRAW